MLFRAHTSRTAAETVGHAAFGEAGYPHAVQIVGVGGHGLVRARDIREEMALGPEIALHVLVIVEVILRQIGEAGPGKGHVLHTLFIDGVGGAFHDADVAAGLCHLGNISVQADGIRRSQGRSLRMAGPAVTHCPHDTDLMAKRGKEPFQKVGAGGLAVGAGDADDGHRQFIRVRLGAGHFREGEPCIPVADEINASSLQAGKQLLRSAFISNHGRGAGLDGLGHILCTVLGRTAHGHENAPRSRFTGIGRNLASPAYLAQQLFIALRHCPLLS